MSARFALVAVWLLASSAAAQSAANTLNANAVSAKATSANAVSGEVESGDPNAARAAFERGRKAYARGDLATAREELAVAHRLSPSPELSYDLARVHERMGDASAARALYREYLERGRPSEQERAQIDKALQTLAELEARQREALDAPAPDASQLSAEARAMFERGVTAFRARRFEAALAAFVAAKSTVALPELDYNLALTCERLGELRDAVDHYRAYVAGVQDDAAKEPVRARIRELEAELSARERARVREVVEQRDNAHDEGATDRPLRPRAEKRPLRGNAPRLR